jgi:hypothetical protein
MMHTVHFSLAVAGGTTLTYRLHGQAIMHDEAAAHISHFPDIEELTQMLIAVGLPASIATGQKQGSFYEVTGQQLRYLGFPVEDSDL